MERRKELVNEREQLIGKLGEKEYTSSKVERIHRIIKNNYQDTCWMFLREHRFGKMAWIFVMVQDMVLVVI